MYHIGVDLGGTNIAAGVVKNCGEIIYSGSVKTKRHRSFDEIMKDLLALCDDVIKKAGLDVSQVTSIGIGAPGSVDAHSKRVIFGNNIPAFTGAEFGSAVKSHYPDMEFFLENDANVAAFDVVPEVS